MAKLARANLYLHGFKTPQITEDDTLTNDKLWQVKKYHCILANPPFMTPKGGIKPHEKFTVKANRSEVLFVDYIAEHLRLAGRAGIIVPEGIIFQAANAYKSLRKHLIEDWGLYAVVSLPSGVFQPYSGVKTSILFLDRQFANTTNEILFLKVENDGFDLGAQRRKIAKNDLPAALEILREWKEQKNINELHTNLTHAVSKNKIAENGEYNLTGDRYQETLDYSNANWEYVKVGDLFDSGRGRVISKSDIQQNQGKYPVYSSQTTDNGIFGYINSYDFEGEYLTWTTDGANAGKVFYRKGKFNCTNVCGTLKLKQEFAGKVNLQFAAPILDKVTYKYVIRVGNPKLMNKEMERIKIPLPPLEVQKKIVVEIEQWQKVIDGAKQVIENYKPSFRIDPEWEMVELGEVCEVLDSKRKPITKLDRKSGEYPYYGATGILDYVRDYIFDEKLVLVGEDGAKWGKGDKTAFIANGKYWVNNHVHVLKPNRNKILDELLVEILNSMDLKNHITGITVPKLNQGNLKKIKIPLPPLEVQEQIIAEIEEEQEAIDECKKLMEKMQKKIEGKIGEVWGE